MCRMERFEQAFNAELPPQTALPGWDANVALREADGD